MALLKKRVNGYFPNNEYELGNFAVPVRAWQYNDEGNAKLSNYVRYTIKGINFVKDLLVEKGYKLK